MKKESSRTEATAPALPQRVELEGLFAMMLGAWYPRNYVVAAIDPEHGEAAVESLMTAGFGRNAVHHESGSGVLRIREAIAAQRTPLQRAAATVSAAITDEGLLSQQYFDAAAMGASLIAVLAPEPRLVGEAGRVLAACGARHLRFYGDTTIIDL